MPAAIRLAGVFRRIYSYDSRGAPSGFATRLTTTVIVRVALPDVPVDVRMTWSFASVALACSSATEARASASAREGA